MNIKSFAPSIATVYGRGSVSCLGEKVKELGVSNAMIVCTFDAEKQGILTNAVNSLQDAGVPFIIYDKAEPDAPDISVNEGARIAREKKIECVIGIGGGSSMDTAKAIGCLIDNPGSINDYLTDPPTFVNTNIPIIVIPTTSGTGSECSDHAVIRDTVKNLKPAVFLYSRLAIIDPELTIGVPPMTTATTGLDAFTHASEAITTRNCDPRSDVMAAAAIRTIAKYLPRAVANGKDIDAREQMSFAANWAGTALQDAGVHFGHCIADGFSAVFNTPHGLNCAWGSPELMRFIAPAVPEKVKLVGESLGIVFFGTETPEEIGSKTASAIRELMHSCGIPSLASMGFPREKVLSAARIAFDSGLKFACPRDITYDDTVQIFNDIYDNYN